MPPAVQQQRGRDIPEMPAFLNLFLVSMLLGDLFAPFFLFQIDSKYRHRKSPHPFEGNLQAFLHLFHREKSNERYHRMGRLPYSQLPEIFLVQSRLDIQVGHLLQLLVNLCN